MGHYAICQLLDRFSPNAGVNQATGNPFEPTESDQQEIGIKYQLPNSNTLLTAALFNINQDNGLYYEVVELDTGPANIQVQRGKLRSRGLAGSQYQSRQWPLPHCVL